MRATDLLSERNVRWYFEISLWAKGIIAVLEILGGLLAWFITRHFLVELATVAVRGELAEDPRDFIANYLLQSAENLSLSDQQFTSIYLLGHGVIKLYLIIGLLRRRLWYYPAGIIVFALFIAYQIYQYTISHSIWLLAVTALDVIVIGLTWHEYLYLKFNTQAAEKASH